MKKITPNDQAYINGFLARHHSDFAKWVEENGSESPNAKASQLADDLRELMEEAYYKKQKA